MSEEKLENSAAKKGKRSNLVMWIITAVVCAALVSVLVWQPKIARSMAEQRRTILTAEEPLGQGAVAVMPEFVAPSNEKVVTRDVVTHTEIDSDVRTEPIEYTVQAGDSIWAIAEKYYASSESEPADVFKFIYTIYNNNYDILFDKADNLKPDQVLVLPPVPGVWYKWKDDDTLQSVANKFSVNPGDVTVPDGFSVSPQDIAFFVGNDIDLANPVITPGTYVMVPGGAKTLINYSYAAVSTDASGNKTSGFTGPGACSFYQTIMGDGFMIWPSSVHFISGNRFMPGHGGIDIGAGEGSPLYAVDDGVVAYAGWLNGGYGNLVVIDHGNGYETFYEHLDQISVSCGSTIYQGNVIGAAGTTGNSTGAHLHFEIRYGGTAVDPFTMLP
ncbi:MAG: M23 family metallopeptidase [Anaerolineaceae bacterium]